jgi:hypothetical protein
MTDLTTKTPTELVARLRALETLSRMTRSSRERLAFEQEWSAIARELNSRDTTEVLAVP